MSSASTPATHRKRVADVGIRRVPIAVRNRFFTARSCGYELNADLNAAYNIRDTFCLAQGGRPALSGLPSTSLSSQTSV
jgi:transposase